LLGFGYGYRGQAGRAWRLYRRFGFEDVLRHFHFPGDDRPFAVLGRQLRA
jgi:ribosomal protein S18 acetylase RimI-like enzyme